MNMHNEGRTEEMVVVGEETQKKKGHGLSRVFHPSGDRLTDAGMR